MTDDLVAFLRARLDEDESSAPLAVEIMKSRSDAARYGVRLLAEVFVKRKILDEHADEGGDCRRCANSDTMDVTYDPDSNEETVTWPSRPLAYPCRTVRLLALPYDAHPDYRADWRP